MEHTERMKEFADGYSITDSGRVYSHPKARGMRGSHNGIYLFNRYNKKGYLEIRLTIDGIKKNYLIHRLVAEAFVDGKTEEKCFVNHINGVKDNDNFTNLEWVTNQENMNHAFSTGLFDKRSEEAMKKTTARIEAFDFNVTRIWTENRKTFVTLIPDCNHGEVTLRADYILEGRYSGLCKECSYKNRNRKENV